jgi:hypothetical protein
MFDWQLSTVDLQAADRSNVYMEETVQLSHSFKKEIDRSKCADRQESTNSAWVEHVFGKSFAWTTFISDFWGRPKRDEQFRDE